MRLWWYNVSFWGSKRRNYFETILELFATELKEHKNNTRSYFETIWELLGNYRAASEPFWNYVGSIGTRRNYFGLFWNNVGTVEAGRNYFETMLELLLNYFETIWTYLALCSVSPFPQI